MAEDGLSFSSSFSLSIMTASPGMPANLRPSKQRTIALPAGAGKSGGPYCPRGEAIERLDRPDQQHRALMTGHPHARAFARSGTLGKPFAVAAAHLAARTLLDRAGDDYDLADQPPAAVIHQRIGRNHRVGG